MAAKALAGTKAAIRGLYAITPDASDTLDLVRRTAAAISGGARVVQYRNKRAAKALARGHALALRALTRARGATFIVNDDVELAALVDADGVHLGRDDGDVASARKNLGDAAIIGVSCYDSLARAEEAVASGVDYVAFGSFFASATKPGTVRVQLQLLSLAKTRLRVPVVAIGGIDATNARALIDAGADALAVIAAVYAAEDIEAAARSISSLFSTASRLPS